MRMDEVRVALVSLGCRCTEGEFRGVVRAVKRVSKKERDEQRSLLRQKSRSRRQEDEDSETRSTATQSSGGAATSVSSEAKKRE